MLQALNIIYSICKIFSIFFFYKRRPKKCFRKYFPVFIILKKYQMNQIIIFSCPKTNLKFFVLKLDFVCMQETMITIYLLHYWHSMLISFWNQSSKIKKLSVDRQSKDLGSNPSLVESVFFSKERFSNSLIFKIKKYSLLQELFKIQKALNFCSFRHIFVNNGLEHFVLGWLNAEFCYLLCYSEKKLIVRYCIN